MERLLQKEYKEFSLKDYRVKEKISLKYQNVTVPHCTESEPGISTRNRPKGLIIVWPQRHKIKDNGELILIAWFIAHSLYWLHLCNIFPTDSVINLKAPPWKYTPKPRVARPVVRDFIIEPDWND